MLLEDPHFRPKPGKSYYQQLADRLASHPALMEEALLTLDRWEAWGKTHPGPIYEWRRLIHAAQASDQGLQDLQKFIRLSDPEAELLLSCCPLHDKSLRSFA